MQRKPGVPPGTFRQIFTTSIDEKQVERLRAARHDADWSIVEPADERRDGATWHTQSNEAD